MNYLSGADIGTQNDMIAWFKWYGNFKTDENSSL